MKRKSSREAAPATADPYIKLEAGYGCEAQVIDGDRLQLTQSNPDAEPDNVVLSKTEFKVISAQFAEWADAPATE